MCLQKIEKEHEKTKKKENKKQRKHTSKQILVDGNLPTAQRKTANRMKRKKKKRRKKKKVTDQGAVADGVTRVGAVVAATTTIEQKRQIR